ncbi:MAG: hypothetical protein FWF03_05260 [Defluviitaleaceae bacterium]|nr:hypothetical protein [Defluviitaleaceae bacterium]
MDPIEGKLAALIDGMEKKAGALQEIRNITENQGTVLGCGLPGDQILAFIVQMNREKQTHIQTVISCDSLFEVILREIGPELDAKQDSYKAEISRLQEQIRLVMDLDVSIRVTEEKNNESMKLLNAENNKAGVSGAIKKGVRRQGEKKRAEKNVSLIQDEKRVIKAYEKNAKNFKG